MARSKIVTLAHGGGGKASAELVETVFVKAFSNSTLDKLSDAAIIDAPANGEKIAISTDSFVIDPLFFPGGNIGSLAVHGTVNDLAVAGATPLYLTVGFVIEEGFAIDDLLTIATAMAQAARAANVTIITGDTKVVPRGSADKLFINTTGFGVVSVDVAIAPGNVAPGDVVILSGRIGDHGMAIMTQREGLHFDVEILSDSKPLNTLTAAIIKAAPGVKMMRDPTRGGLAASLTEIAKASRCGIVINESALPISQAVQAVAEILGIDPLYIANEGALVAFIPEDQADAALSAMRENEAGRNAVIIGNVIEDVYAEVVMKTAFGGERIVESLVGDQLPRIC